MFNQQFILAIQAALKAGAAISQIYNKHNYTVTLKEDQSPVTEADLESHQIITQQLTPTQLPVLSEEGNPDLWNQIHQTDRYWMIDPLDGTREFINRNGEFTVNIALIEDKKPIWGIIYIPEQRQLYAGVKGAGAWKWENIDNHYLSKQDLQEKAITLPTREADNEYRIVGSKSHKTHTTDAFIARISEVISEIKIVRAGSSLKFCHIASGEADLYPRMDTIMEWDVAAGHAIIEAAGGLLKRWPDGDSILYNSDDMRFPTFLALAPGRTDTLFFK
ncbi:3'(2'),5'-bisphosphate nucleotidase CysQ [Geofilum sp. OHC36d9]|uniref:3'(2'),5'-bisphosphate nucleotidase CysQ n=1 Tax=Geofilum sp. OHC36d9 TaxID=3458413 RepID=UPI004033CDA0